MNPLKQLPLIAFLVLTAITAKAHAQSSVTSAAPMKPALQAAAPVAPAAPHVKSYREWKHELVVDAYGKITTLKAQIENRKQSRAVAQGMDPNLGKSRGLEAIASRDLALERLEKDLRAEQYDLEVANDLTVTDYFVGYLTKVQNKKAAFQEVAGKLSPDEVAELMTAYANSVFGAHAADLPASAANVAKEPVK